MRGESGGEGGRGGGLCECTEVDNCIVIAWIFSRTSYNFTKIKFAIEDFFGGFISGNYLLLVYVVVVCNEDDHYQ